MGSPLRVLPSDAEAAIEHIGGTIAQHHVRSHYPGSAFWALAAWASASTEQHQLGPLCVLQGGLRLRCRVLAVGVCAATEAAAAVRVGAAAKPVSKLRREYALGVSGTVPPFGYRREFGELSKIFETANYRIYCTCSRPLMAQGRRLSALQRLRQECEGLLPYPRRGKLRAPVTQPRGPVHCKLAEAGI
jgi:hypothetical protein